MVYAARNDLPMNNANTSRAINNKMVCEGDGVVAARSTRPQECSNIISVSVHVDSQIRNDVTTFSVERKTDRAAASSL